MAPAVTARADYGTSAAPAAASSSSGLSTTLILGFAVAGAILLAAVAWGVLRVVRKRAQRQRRNSRGGAFLTVKGLVKEDEAAQDEKAAAADIPTVALNGTQLFSRNNLAHGVTMPDRALIPADASRAEILAYHTETQTLPKPFHFALAASGASPPASPGASTTSFPASSVPASPSRGSWRSSVFALGGLVGGGAGSVRSSVASHRRDSSLSTLAGAGAQRRKVRQGFQPVLPDELVLALGETLTVVRSFDDGWCVVGREASVFAAAAAASAGAAAFGQHRAPEAAAVEMGAVPAWVFVRPTKGLRAERPMRSSSLGVTVGLDGAPAPNAPFSSREECVSWSNF